jgi:hypothetical protein
MNTNIHPQHLANIPAATLEGLDPKDLGMTFGVSYLREDGPVIFFYHGFTFTETNRPLGAPDKYKGKVGSAPSILGMVDIIARLEEEIPRPCKDAPLPCPSTAETMEIAR